MGRDEKMEREGRKVFPATTRASKDTPKEERRRVPSYDKSIQGHPRRKEVGEGKEKERKREGEKGRGEKRKGQVFPATKNRPGTHQRRKGEILSIPFRKTPESKERKGERGQGRRGLSSPQVPMDLKLALTAVVTLCPAEAAGCFDRCGHVKA